MREAAFVLVMVCLWLSGVMVGWYRCRLAVHADVWKRHIAVTRQFLADMEEASAAGDSKAWQEAIHKSDGANAVWDATWPQFEHREVWHKMRSNNSTTA